MDIFHVLFVLVICVLCYIIFNLSRKVRVYESLVSNYDSMAENIKEYMKQALNKLISIDRNQVFEADDDVGYFFKSLKEEIVKLNNNIAGIFNEETEESVGK